VIRLGFAGYRLAVKPLITAPAGTRADSGQVLVCDQTALVHNTRRKDWISRANGALLR
jgi:hypothetical protein